MQVADRVSLSSGIRGNLPVHRGPFGPAEGRKVVESLQRAQSSQVAIAFVNDRATNVRPYIGADA